MDGVLPSPKLVKETLVRRGVLQTANMRQPGVLELDEADFRELDIALGEIKHLFTAEAR